MQKEETVLHLNKIIWYNQFRIRVTANIFYGVAYLCITVFLAIKSTCSLYTFAFTFTLKIKYLIMATNEEYYNESYAPINDDYLAAEAWEKRKKANSNAMRAHATTIMQNTSRPKRQSLYDEDGYALPDYDFEPSQSQSRHGNVTASEPKEKTERNKMFTWKFAILAFAALTLISIAGGLAYLFTKSAGNHMLQIFLFVCEDIVLSNRSERIS